VSSLAALLLLAGGIVLVVAGAELFFDGLLAVAARLRLSAFVLTVVVSGFELENLAAGIAADLKGLPNAAAGTFLGGTTFLALAVSGLAATVRPIRAALPPAVLAWTAAAPFPLLALGLDGRLSRLDGAALVLWFGVAITGIARSGRTLVGPELGGKRRFALVRMLAGLGLLSGGGELLGEGLRRTVAHLGASETLLGNTAVAATVEAEEVTRVAVPARRGRGDVALGNILGTIAHFAAFNAGVIALVRPLELDRASKGLHLPVAAGATIVLVWLVARGQGLRRRQGIVLLGLYAAYVACSIVVATV
jgi:cation:H+ antiporter